MHDIRQSKNFSKLIETQNWETIFFKNNYFYLKKLPFLGYFVKIQRPNSLNSYNVSHALKNKNVFRILIEPKNTQQEHYLQTINAKKISPYIPSKTLVLDLSQNNKTLLKSMRKSTRYIIKHKIKKIKIKEIKTKDDIKIFRKNWKSAVTFKHYVPNTNKLNNLKNIYKDNAYIISTNNGGAVFLKSNNKVYYWHGFTNKLGKKNFEAYKLLWEGIIWSKKQKAQLFDFEGIYDERNPIKSWLGFSKFKKGFGGNEYLWPNSYITKISKFT